MISFATVVTKNCLTEFLLMKYSCEQFNEAKWYLTCDNYSFEYFTQQNYNNVVLIECDIDDSISDHNSTKQESMESFVKIVLQKFTAIRKALEDSKSVILIDTDMIFTGKIEDNIMDLLSNKQVDFLVCPHYTNNLKVEFEFGYYNTGMVGINDAEKIKIWEKITQNYKELKVYTEQKPFELVAKNYSCLSLPINYDIGWWRFNQKDTQERLKQIKLENDEIYFGKSKAVNFHMHVFKAVNNYNPGLFLVDLVIKLMKQSNNEKYKNIVNYYNEIYNNIKQESHLEFSKRETSWKSLYYGIVADIINKNNVKTFIEVGMGLGQHSEQILDNCKMIEKSYGIDPYMPYDETDQFHKDVSAIDDTLTPKENFDKLCKAIINRINLKHKDRFTHIRKPSKEAANDFEDKSIDLIFLDGNHKYEYVLEDCEAWFPKLINNGIMCGDDFYMEDVKRAVTEFAKKHNRELKLIKNPNNNYIIWRIDK